MFRAAEMRSIEYSRLRRQARHNSCRQAPEIERGDVEFEFRIGGKGLKGFEIDRIIENDAPDAHRVHQRLCNSHDTTTARRTGWRTRRAGSPSSGTKKK
jgi:hypothetical protein